MAGDINSQVNFTGLNLFFVNIQKDVSLSLDLSAFACSQVEVSFSVVTQQEYTEFSPTQSVCVEGGILYIGRICGLAA